MIIKIKSKVSYWRYWSNFGIDPNQGVLIQVAVGEQLNYFFSFHQDGCLNAKCQTCIHLFLWYFLFIFSRRRWPIASKSLTERLQWPPPPSTTITPKCSIASTFIISLCVRSNNKNNKWVQSTVINVNTTGIMTNLWL